MPKQQMRLRKPKSNALRRDDGAGGFLSPALALGKGLERQVCGRSPEPYATLIAAVASNSFG
jgi:hypothetical protein